VGPAHLGQLATCHLVLGRHPHRGAGPRDIAKAPGEIKAYFADAPQGHQWCRVWHSEHPPRRFENLVLLRLCREPPMFAILTGQRSSDDGHLLITIAQHPVGQLLGNRLDWGTTTDAGIKLRETLDALCRAEHREKDIVCMPDDVVVTEDPVTLHFCKRVMGYNIRFDRSTGKPFDDRWSDWQLVAC